MNGTAGCTQLESFEPQALKQAYGWGTCRMLDRRDCTPSGFNWLSLYLLKYEDYSGRTFTWEAVERRPRGAAGANCAGVAVLAKVVSRSRAAQVPVVVQFRPPLGGLCIELPAGLVEPGQSLEETAVRELREETGYVGRVTAVSPPLAESAGLTNASCAIALVEVDGDAPENAAPQPQPECEAGEVLRCELLPYGALLEALLRLRDSLGGTARCGIDSRLYAVAMGMQHGPCGGAAQGLGMQAVGPDGSPGSGVVVRSGSGAARGSGSSGAGTPGGDVAGASGNGDPLADAAACANDVAYLTRGLPERAAGSSAAGDGSERPANTSRSAPRADGCGPGRSGGAGCADGLAGCSPDRAGALNAQDDDTGGGRGAVQRGRGRGRGRGGRWRHGRGRDAQDAQDGLPPLRPARGRGRSTVGGGGRKGFAGSNAGPVLGPGYWTRGRNGGLRAAAATARGLLDARGWLRWAAADPVALSCGSVLLACTMSAGVLAALVYVQRGRVSGL